MKKRILVLMLMLLCVMGAVGCEFGKKEAESEKKTAVDNDETRLEEKTESGEGESETIKKIYDDEEWVYIADEFSDRYTDDVGNSSTYRYTVPAFNIESDAAKEINSEISNEINVYHEETLGAIEEGCSLFIHEVNAKYYVNGEIVSLITEVVNDWGANENKCYNMSNVDGRKITNSELVELMGYSRNQFVEKLKEITGDYYEDIYKDAPVDKDKFYQDRYDFTVSDECCNMSIPMFVGENGNLFVVAKIGSIAGASYYEHVLDTGMNIETGK